MNANELMIGDWVKCEDKTARINQIEDILCMENENTSWFAYPEEVSPIPLTPEILEKNGFKKADFPGIDNQHTWTLVLDTMYYVSLWTRNLHDNADEGWTFKAETSQVNGGLLLNAVHELQHALRLCGIEKEITI